MSKEMVTKSFRFDKKVMDAITNEAEQENRSDNNMVETILKKRYKL